MLPRFGCGIHEYVFAPNSPATRGDIAHQVQQALARWEPRIDVLRVAVEPGDPGAVTSNLLADPPGVPHPLDQYRPKPGLSLLYPGRADLKPRSDACR